MLVSWKKSSKGFANDIQIKHINKVGEYCIDACWDYTVLGACANWPFSLDDDGVTGYLQRMDHSRIVAQIQSTMFCSRYFVLLMTERCNADLCNHTTLSRPLLHIAIHIPNMDEHRH